MSQSEPVLAHDGMPWQQWRDSALPVVVWSTDTELRIVTIQGAVLADLGWCSADLQGRGVGELLAGAPCRSAVEAAHRVALTGQHRPLTFTLGSHPFRGTVAPIVDEQGTVVGTAMAAFPQGQIDAPCEAITQAAEQRVVFLKPDGTIEHINRTTGSTRREALIGKSIYDFVPPAERDALRNAIMTVVRGGPPVTVELESRNRLGNVACESLRIGPVCVAGKIEGLVLLATDVTSHKRVIRELQEEEAFLKQLLELQERERQLVACEIHDGFIQEVIGARMLIESLAAQFRAQEGAVARRLERALNLLGKAISEGRRLVSELRPMIIDEMGLVEAVQYLVNEETARSDTHIEFTARVGFDRLDPILQATIFRVIREAVTNAQRHGRARRIDIRMTEVGPTVIVEIQDDGCGFNPKRVAPHRYGLQGIRDRALLFGGGATIESAPDQGTRVTLKLPTNLPDISDSTHLRDAASGRRPG